MLNMLHFSREEEKVEVSEPAVGYSVHITDGDFESPHHRVYHLKGATEFDECTAESTRIRKNKYEWEKHDGTETCIIEKCH